MKNYYNIIETLVGILCVDKGKLKVLLKIKQTDPYKGYWILPGGILENNETLQTNVTNVIFNSTHIKNMYFKECHVFSDLNRDPDDRILAASFIALTTKEIVAMNEVSGESELKWFELNALPKMGYDHNAILNKINSEVRNSILSNHSDVILKLFPNDFTIPELQKCYENVLGKQLDRRNFRKKLILQDIIVDTGFKTSGGAGRPGTLYRFNSKNRSDFNA